MTINYVSKLSNGTSTYNLKDEEALHFNDADNVTISESASNKLQSIGTVNKNPATGATAYKYDWIGTAQEYNAQQISTTHPDWICYITDDVVETQGIVSRKIGEIITSTLPITDAGLHLLDGSVLSSASGYGAFVDYIAGLISTYSDLFVSESDWQTAVTTYGVCGKFVYDSTNNTVRLPKITGFTEGTIDPTTLGDLTEAGLPNITGTHCGGFGADRARSGAFSGTWRTAQAATGGKDYNNSGGDSGWEIKFDASGSNSIYGNSSTVQPQSIKVLYYIVVATTVTNELNIDVANVMENISFLEPYYDYTYTQVGTLTQTDGILSGFSSGNYVIIGNIDANPTSYEVLIKVKSSDVTVTQDVCGSSSNGSISTSVPQIRIQGSKFSLITTGGSATITDTIQNNTWYWVKATYDGTTAKLYISTDGETFVEEASVATTVAGNAIMWLGSGYGQSSEVPLTNGEIDLNYSYIKINNNTIWQGKILITSKKIASSLGMPSSKFINLTLGASDTAYKAPANGFLYFQKQSTGSNQNIAFQKRDSDGHGYIGTRVYSSASGQYLAIYMPVKKDDLIYVTYNSSSTSGQYFRFVYAEGEN